MDKSSICNTHGWDSSLTQKIPVELPIWRKYSSAPQIQGYSHITSLTPIIKSFLPQAEGEGQLQADNLFARVQELEGFGTCLVETVKRKKKRAYCKVTHLLDPIRTMQGYYLGEKGEQRRVSKLENPMNQAYVDSLGNYLLGQLRERNLSPHFCLFYGGFRGIADRYRFSITDEFESYRKYRAFWEKKQKGLFGVYVDDESVSSAGTSVHSARFSYSTPKSHKSSDSHISLDDLGEQVQQEVELESVSSFPELVSEGSTATTAVDDSQEETEEEEEELEEEDVKAEFKSYPVMLIFQEQMDGVLDDLLEDEEEQENQGTPAWEEKWSAWTFQIIAALCAAQGVLGFTHNDLHTNNIVFSKMDQPWLFYKNRAGEVWRIPTFGKIFHIIDFGRAVFRIGDKWFISDDYETGGDAEGQYNFEAMSTKKDYKPLVYPNPSFDLCRFSVSVLDALFPEMPIEKLDGSVINQEEGWTVHETESPLWNLLWGWLIDDKGRNVLKDEDGMERFPDFDLYTHIAAFCHSAKPQEQIGKEIFSRWKVSAGSVGDWETIYPLFC